MLTIFNYLLRCFGSLNRAESQKGATLIEYVLIVAVIAIAVFAAANFGLGDAISDVFTDAQTTIEGDE